MQTFKERIMITFSGIALFSIFLVILFLFSAFSIGLFIYLPSYLISRFSETWATIWIFSVLIGLVAFALFDDMRRWFVWQFISPFKK